MWVAQIPKPRVPLASLHRLLFAYFPDHPANAPRPFLFRIEHDSLILGSTLKPSCAAKHVQPQAGMTYQFDAIVKPMNGGGRNPIDGNARRRDWVARNLRGAQIGYCEVYDLPDLRTRKSDGRRIVVPVCRVVGALTVTDADEFIRFLRRGGPGTAKAYGCGMWVLPELMEVSVGRHHPFERRAGR
ncbi:type I-E CRISPR-associated protein Cas6/Cse3/CasE [Caldimonas thermodepolymerans]|uniref:CRISPR-associated protein Cse3 family n=1 Tax=Caldimonas thermodepolymerans TaxID=215580 RepID=A0AA46DCP5_9BURK|nr:type I-E CRISPR-associated protein Cas6/Cse3/CasE [Caldimonas thermodepolymerans]TCP06604.1 CRISPR-associated protein Cse3 family [Caldimonas thermodepolymerans]UZG49338.1 type I-E CRISPR-associated protein Cas6/Cse3/CasE [Caldimonas thermodepolymerans]